MFGMLTYIALAVMGLGLVVSLVFFAFVFFRATNVEEAIEERRKKKIKARLRKQGKRSRHL